MALVDFMILAVAGLEGGGREVLAEVEVNPLQFGRAECLAGEVSVGEHPVYREAMGVLTGSGGSSEDGVALLRAKAAENGRKLTGPFKRLAARRMAELLREFAEEGSWDRDGWRRVERVFGPVEVAVDGGGRPVLLRGAIALALAVFCKRESVPARVVRRDPAWEAFRARLFAFAAESGDEETRVRKDLTHYGGKLYQQAYHFDTLDVPYHHGRERVELIRPHLLPGAKTLLDIGANQGLFCMEFERMGLECTAVEMKADDLWLMKALRDACGGGFRIYEGSIFDFGNGGVLEYDVVLALFIFHHFMKTRELHDKLVGLLGRIRCRQMFLGVPDPGEPQMEGAYRNPGAAEFAEFVMTHSGMGRYEVLASPWPGGRAILKIER